VSEGGCSAGLSSDLSTTGTLTLRFWNDGCRGLTCGQVLLSSKGIAGCKLVPASSSLPVDTSGASLSPGGTFAYEWPELEGTSFNYSASWSIDCSSVSAWRRRAGRLLSARQQGLMHARCWRRARAPHRQRTHAAAPRRRCMHAACTAHSAAHTVT
jgi:hypothetical protein